MTYVLIVITSILQSSSGATVAMHDFSNKERCEQVRTLLLSESAKAGVGRHVSAICVAK